MSRHITKVKCGRTDVEQHVVLIYSGLWMLITAAIKQIRTPEPSSSRNTETYGSSLAVKSISSLKQQHKISEMQHIQNSITKYYGPTIPNTYSPYSLSYNVPIQYNITGNDLTDNTTSFFYPFLTILVQLANHLKTCYYVYLYFVSQWLFAPS